MLDFYVVSSINACKQSGCHLGALEGNLAIIESILSPFCKETPLLTCGIVPHSTSLVGEDKLVRNVIERYHI